MIIKPEQMDFSEENITMIIYGLPGTGKTTLACSAPEPVIIDCDRGLKRVRPEHRRDGIMVKSFEELLKDINCISEYKTAVIDTGGAFVELLKDWAMRTDPKASKKTGGFSQQGFGIVKERFLAFTAQLRRTHNVIYIFHAVKDKLDDSVFYELVCEGSAKTLVWQPCDLGAYLHIENGERYLGFTPTSSYNAKAAYGIKGLVKVPELGDGAPNDFLAKLFERVKETLTAEKEIYAERLSKYEEVMADGQAILQEITAENAIDILRKLRDLKHTLTSQKELDNIFKAKIKEQGLVYNPKTKAYEQQ